MIEEYGRQYCDKCGQYAPDGYGGGKGLTCPKCGGMLTFVKEYDRYYCNKDQEYAPEDLGREPAPAPPAEELREPSFDELLPPEPEEEAAKAPEAERAPEAPAPAVPVAAEAPPKVEEERAPEELPEEEAAEPPEVARPPLIRDEILRAKKAALMDLASAHGFDTMGTKEEIKERLLAELDRREREEEERRKAEEAKAVPEAAPAPEVPAVPAVEVPPEAKPTPPAEAPSPPAQAAIVVQEAPPTPAPQPAPVVVVEAPKVPAVEAAPEAAKVAHPCPTCGKELAYVRQYDRYYCFDCKRYAPVEEKAAPPGAMAVVEAAPKPVPAPAPTPAPKPPAVKNPCPTCGKELTYVKQYGRFYCHSCKKYAPAKPRNPCPTCGKELMFIATYQRHYCPACGKYAPADLTKQILATRSTAAVAAPAAAVAPARVVADHRHSGAPGAGIGLVATGIVLLLLYMILYALPKAMNGIDTPPYIVLDAAYQELVYWTLQLVGLLLLAFGVIAGLVRLRTVK